MDLLSLSGYRAVQCHSHVLTCASLSSDDTFAVVGSKDCKISLHDVETGKVSYFPGGSRHEEKTLNGHKDHVLAVAVSSDGRVIASGGRDHLIKVWDVRTHQVIDTLEGHRGAVSALAFRHGSRDLYSGSYDRTVKVWNCEDMGYVETLFGHQSEVTSIDALSKERCVSGGNDQTARLWKIPEETHLVFRAGFGAIDSLSLLTDSTFVSGSSTGTVSLWNVVRKKPLHSIFHGPSKAGVTAVAARPYSDLAASASSDGYIRFFTVKDSKLVEVNKYALPGFVNAMAISRSGKFAIATTGREHRLGRWNVIKAKNALHYIPLPITE